MKPPIKLLGAGMLLGILCAAFTACNGSSTEPDGETRAPEQEQNQEQNEEETEILSVPVSDEVSAYFENYLPEFPGHDPESEFSFGDGNFPFCLTINSIQELREVAPPSVELPSIDFNKHTLVVGQYLHPAGFVVKRQSIIVKEEEMELILELESDGKGALAVMIKRRQWGLYSKLPKKPIAFPKTNTAVLP